MINIKSTAVIVVIGYGLYHFFSTHDLTPFPPMKDEVVKALQPKYGSEYRMEVVKECVRSGGDMLNNGVFTCGVEFESKNGSTQPYTEDVRIGKHKGKWVLK